MNMNSVLIDNFHKMAGYNWKHMEQVVYSFHVLQVLSSEWYVLTEIQRTGESRCKSDNSSGPAVQEHLEDSI